jgi:lysophospholipase L1-like esterase
VRHYVEGLGGAVSRFGVPGSAYERIRMLSQNEGVRFIDLFPKFLEGGNEDYFPHDLHWSPKGHRVAAERIAEAMAAARAKTRR